MTLARPMLARKHTPGEILPYPMLASVKLDGVRCLVIGGKPMSRKLLPLPNRGLADWLPWGDPLLRDFDGELVLGPPNAPDAYNRTSSAVMSHDAPLEGLVFWVFDCFTQEYEPPQPYEKRLARAASRLDKLPECYRDRVRILPFADVRDDSEMALVENHVVVNGYEGLMLRDPHAPYKQGRTAGKEHGLIKIKRFEDAEAVIEAVHPLMRNHNEQTRNELGLAKRSTHQANKVADALLGSLDVRDVTTGVRFSIGSGFDDATRRALWFARGALPGQLVKYRYQPAGVKEAPRFPTYLGLRHAMDT